MMVIVMMMMVMMTGPPLGIVVAILKWVLHHESNDERVSECAEHEAINEQKHHY